MAFCQNLEEVSRLVQAWTMAGCVLLGDEPAYPLSRRTLLIWIAESIHDAVGLEVGLILVRYV